MRATEPERRFETIDLPGGVTGRIAGILIDVPRRVSLSCPCARVERTFKTSWATVEGINADLIRRHAEAAPDCTHSLDASAANS